MIVHKKRNSSKAVVFKNAGVKGGHVVGSPQAALAKRPPDFWIAGSGCRMGASGGKVKRRDQDGRAGFWGEKRRKRQKPRKSCRTNRS